jgi:hypothetical protein
MPDTELKKKIRELFIVMNTALHSRDPAKVRELKVKQKEIELLINPPQAKQSMIEFLAK